MFRWRQSRRVAPGRRLSGIAFFYTAAALGILLCSVASTNAQAPVATVTPTLQTPSPDLLRVDPRVWVVDAANNQIRTIRHENSWLRYTVNTADDRGQRTRDTIESRDGSVARLLRRNGRPLSPEEDRAERDRLEGLLASPSAFSKHVRDDSEGKKLAIDLIGVLPDAMSFTYAPGQPQLDGVPGTQIVIDYVPKPGWNPPSSVSAGLKGLRGRAWIDARSRHVTRMEGEIFQGVNFGWGMLAHIYPGGHLFMEQRNIKFAQDPTQERWSIIRFQDDLKVRAMMVKTINVRSEINLSKFQVLPAPVSYQEAIQMLLNSTSQSIANPSSGARPLVSSAVLPVGR